MDYIAYPLMRKAHFYVPEGNTVFATGQPESTIEVHRVINKTIEFGSWQSKSVSFHPLPQETVSSINSLPANECLCWDAQDVGISLFHVEQDSTYAHEDKVPQIESSDVLGTCVLDGSKDIVIGPLHLPSIRGGAIFVDILDAVRADGYGRITVEHSYDGQDWLGLPGNGLSHGALYIYQHGLRTGDTYGDEFLFTNRGEYIRLVYEAEKIAAWGFKANVTIVTKR